MQQELLKLLPQQISSNLQEKDLHPLNLKHLHLHFLEQMLLELEQKGAEEDLHLWCQVIHFSLAVATTSAKVIYHVSSLFS